jgi:hypothetical protein
MNKKILVNIVLVLIILTIIGLVGYFAWNNFNNLKISGVIELSKPPLGETEGGNCGVCFTSNDGKYNCALITSKSINDFTNYIGKNVTIYATKYEGVTNMMCPTKLLISKVEIK